MWAIVNRDNQVIRVLRQRQSFTDAAGVQHPETVLALWPLEDLRRAGVYPLVALAPVDETENVVSTAFTVDTVERVVRESRVTAAVPIQTLRDRLHAQVNGRREEKVRAGVTHAGRRWQSDRESLLNLTGTIAHVNAGNPLPAGFTWRDFDNVDVPMDIAGLKALSNAIFLYVNGCYKASWRHKADIAAMGTVAAYRGYDWSRHWPTS